LALILLNKKQIAQIVGTIKTVISRPGFVDIEEDNVDTSA
jgi:hypothetical protein